MDGGGVGGAAGGSAAQEPPPIRLKVFVKCKARKERIVSAAVAEEPYQIFTEVRPYLLLCYFGVPKLPCVSCGARHCSRSDSP